MVKLTNDCIESAIKRMRMVDSVQERQALKDQAIVRLEVSNSSNFRSKDFCVNLGWISALRYCGFARQQNLVFAVLHSSERCSAHTSGGRQDAADSCHHVNQSERSFFVTDQWRVFL